MAISRRAVVAAWVALALAGPARADSLTLADPFVALNDATIAIYRDAKTRFHAIADPVVIVGFDDVMVRHAGVTRRLGHIPLAYEQLKAAGHAVRSTWAALRPAIEGLDPEATWRSKTLDLRPKITAVLAALPRSALTPEAIARDTAMLTATQAAIDAWLKDGPPDEAGLDAFMRAQAPTLLADFNAAADLQLDAIDADLRPWWNGLTDAERASTYVIVLGPKTPRAGNLAFTYFTNLLGPGSADERVIYAEGIYDERGGEALLAQLLTDRRLSVDLFADEHRMERDILADGAEAWVLQHFGRLGRP
ncbi:MAG: hypothetical protein U1E45_24930 [Geminicoccaceae bacterium]